MTKIPVSPSVYDQGVAKYGQEAWGALFRVTELCQHQRFTLKVRRRFMASHGPFQSRVTVYQNCLDCSRQSFGMEFWEST